MFLTESACLFVNTITFRMINSKVRQIYRFAKCKQGGMALSVTKGSIQLYRPKTTYTPVEHECMLSSSSMLQNPVSRNKI